MLAINDMNSSFYSIVFQDSFMQFANNTSYFTEL